MVMCNVFTTNFIFVNTYDNHMTDNTQEMGRRSGLVVELQTPEREVGGSILTQVAVLYP